MNVFKTGCLAWFGILAFLTVATVLVSLWIIVKVTSSIF